MLRQRFRLIVYVGSNLFMQAATLAGQLWSLKYLSPELLGIWRWMAVLSGYILVSRMGIVNAMNREYPYFLGKAEYERAKEVAQTGMAYQLLNGAAVMLVFIVLALTYGQRGTAWRLAFVMMGLQVMINSYLQCLEGIFRSHNRFYTISIIRIVQGVFLIATVALVWAYGFNGYCVRSVVVLAVAVVLMHWLRPARICPRLVVRQFRLMFSTGLRMFLWNYLTKEAKVFSELVLGVLAGREALGLFAPVHWMAIAMSGITGSLNSYLYPRMTYRYARGNFHVGRAAIRTSLLLMLLMTPIIVVGILLIPIVLPWINPQYAQASIPAQIALGASLLECMAVTTFVFPTLKAWKPMYVYIGIALVARGGGAVMGYCFAENKLMGVALGMLAASAVMAVTTYITVLWADKKALAKEEKV